MEAIAIQSQHELRGDRVREHTPSAVNDREIERERQLLRESVSS
jgi:hypothetical protein